MRLLIFILPTVIFFSISFSQETVVKDSVKLPVDSTIVDSTRSVKDTTTVSGVDTVVNYSSADSIVYSLNTKTMSLYNKGDIKYQKMALQAERIDINWNTSVMKAYGIPDTSDTTDKREKGAPVMTDAGEVYHGKELSYNFKTKRGRITVADTKLDQGYYHGEQLKKIGPNEFFVADGRYTTCDKNDPDFYFFSPKMKVSMQDKVIAEPMYLYVSDVPIFWFPVAVFPNKGGRRSGIITPAIAEDSRHGRILKHIGYYWAISDYMDFNVKTDLYTKGSWALYSNYQYNLMYNFNGGVSGEYRKMIEGEASDPTKSKEESYSVHITHRQEINPTTRFDVNFTFASNNAYQNTIDINRALQQDITSNATFSKSWEGTPNSIGINISRQQSLISGNISEVLPSLSFSHSQSFPFRFGKKNNFDLSTLAWYEMISVGYGAIVFNSRAKTKKTIDFIKVVGRTDTVQSVDEYEYDHSQGISQNINVNIAPKLGYFTISPQLSYQDVRSFYSNDVPELNRADSSLKINNYKTSSRAGYFSSGVTASTKLYGIVQPGILGITALRHTINPNLSFTYKKQIIGENLQPKQMLMGFNVSNVFEMKTTTSQEGQEENKIQLLNIGAGINYDFAKDSMKLSDIGVSYRTAIGNLLDIGGDASFSLYQRVWVGQNQYQDINKFLIKEEGRLARMTNFRLSLSTSLAGEKKSSGRGGTSSTDTTMAQHKPTNGYYGLYHEDEDPDFSIPWRLSLSWEFSESKVQPNPNRSSNVRGNLEFNLTENWKFSMSGGYDIYNKEIVVPQINITRDLHCWLMNFSWVPIGAYRNYQFEIRLKAPQLQDIKVTKQGSARGIY